MGCRPAAGGYGDPLERDPEAVLRDVRDELVSVGQAFDDYGVVDRARPRTRGRRGDGHRAHEEASDVRFPDSVTIVEVGPARRPAEPGEHLSDRRQGRDGRAARGDRPAQDRGDGHGAARRHPAARRCGGRPPARDPPTRRRLPGAVPEPPRRRAGGRRRRGRAPRAHHGERDVQPQELEHVGRREPRPGRPDGGGRPPGRRPHGHGDRRLHVLPLRG